MRTMLGVVAVGSLLALLAPAAAADPAEPSAVAPEAEAPEDEAAIAKEQAEFEAKLGFQTGTISLVGGKAQLVLPAGYRYLGPDDTGKVLSAWGNPAGEHAGMLVPAEVSIFDDDSFAVIIDYIDDGHVDDSDAASVDYDQLLRDMRADGQRENEARKAQGLATAELIGWAEAPHYDARTRKLYWAKELAFSSSPEHTLNYAVRVLGREGVLQLNAVSSIVQLPKVKQEMQAVLGFAEFTPGNLYADYKEGSDRSAGYGIAAVVAGGVAAKAIGGKGFFALLLGMKKLLIVVAIAVAAGAKALWSRLSGRRTEA